MVTRVDDSDFEWLNKFNWYAKGTGNGRIYAVTGSKKIRMHRLLVPGVRLVDHRNRDTLDNQRKNLRPATRTDNGANAKRRRDNSSGFKGVCWKPNVGGWVARITVRGRRFYLGKFKDPAEAGQAYDRAAKKQFGEFACVNASLTTKQQ